jgi:hypothetical protein
MLDLNIKHSGMVGNSGCAAAKCASKSLLCPSPTLHVYDTQCHWQEAPVPWASPIHGCRHLAPLYLAVPEPPAV